MAVTISGKLIGPNGDPRSAVTIMLTAVRTSSAVVQLAPSVSLTDEEGNYSLSVEVGTHNVMIEAYGRPFEKVGAITVYADSKPGTINDFLNSPSESELSPAIVSMVDDMRAAASDSAMKAEAYRDEARHFSDLAEAIADVSLTFPNITSGLAGTSSGQYFRVPGEASDQNAFYYYRNTAGSALFVTSLISPNYVDARLVPGNYIPSFFPILQDVNGAVPLWLDEGKIDAAGFGPQLIDGVTGIASDWSKTYLRQLDIDPSFFPILQDVNGAVPLWLDEGKIDAAGFGPILHKYITDLIGGNAEPQISSYIEGDKYKFTFKRGRVFSNAATSLNIAFTGDSWTEKNTIPQSMINLLGGTYKDPGWISCSTRTDGVMSGIALAVSGFTKYDGDNENNNSAPQYGSGPDGNAYYNNNTVGTLTWSNVKATDLSLYYYDGTGSFTITIDGGSPVTITGGGTSVTKKYDISGLSSSSHTVVITSSGAGIVSIFGMYGKNSGIASGITISRMGNGGAMAKDFLNWRSWISPVVSTLDIDLLFVILGTNDFRKSAGVDEYKNGIQAIIDAYKAATPGICICLVSPGQCSATGIPSLLEYDKAMRDIATDNEVNFISGYQLFPKTYDNSNGAWADTLHLSSLGAYVLTRKIKDEFMKD